METESPIVKNERMKYINLTEEVLNALKNNPSDDVTRRRIIKALLCKIDHDGYVIESMNIQEMI